MKKVKIIAPYLHPQSCNFKRHTFDCFLKTEFECKKGLYPPKKFHWLIYRIGLPLIKHHTKEVHLCLVEPVSINFDTFPDYMFYEIIPMIWDCWPMYDDKVVAWLEKYKVKSCIFTSSEAAKRIKERLPKLNVLFLAEGINVERYDAGVELKDRDIDLYTYGRLKNELYNVKIDCIIEKRGGNNEEFQYRLQNSKIVIALPQCDVLPERTGGQETLTQRFWEGMLSRTVLVGRAPKELIDLIGYNPVIDIDYNNYTLQIKNILENIEDYQELVNKNRETALKHASWEKRMGYVKTWLESLGYEV